MAARQRTLRPFSRSDPRLLCFLPICLDGAPSLNADASLARMRFRYRDAAAMLLGSAHELCAQLTGQPQAPHGHVALDPADEPRASSRTMSAPSNSAAAFLPTARAGTSALHAQTLAEVAACSIRPSRPSRISKLRHRVHHSSSLRLPSSTHLACNHTTTRQMCRLLRSEVSTSKP